MVTFPMTEAKKLAIESNTCTTLSTINQWTSLRVLLTGTKMRSSDDTSSSKTRREQVKWVSWKFLDSLLLVRRRPCHPGSGSLIPQTPEGRGSRSSCPYICSISIRLSFLLAILGTKSVFSVYQVEHLKVEEDVVYYFREGPWCQYWTCLLLLSCSGSSLLSCSIRKRVASADVSLLLLLHHCSWETNPGEEIKHGHLHCLQMSTSVTSETFFWTACRITLLTPEIMVDFAADIQNEFSPWHTGKVREVRKARRTWRLPVKLRIALLLWSASCQAFGLSFTHFRAPRILKLHALRKFTRDWVWFWRLILLLNLGLYGGQIM